ncbi:MAG: MBL fold metallo-hydrolase [Deltaproteobacteria bacterium]|nr:MBL fold metallo-hydrolase [Deltaproteobacteria bacterium]
MASLPDVDTGRLTLCMLASGSKGNAIYLSDGRTSVLIDAGLSGKEIERRLGQQNIDPESISAIVVSHEHSDHIQGVGVLSRRYQLPVYINPDTLAAAPKLGKLFEVRPFECGRSFHLDGLLIHPFSISHDAADPAGFTISQNGAKIGIATDLGIATGMVKEHLRDCSALVLEANHDPDMLINGPYPWYLKQRIRGRTGHLSNQASGDLLQEIQHGQLSHVVLAHLSETNNTHQIAYDSVFPALTRCRPQISVASQDRSGALISL